MINILIFAFAVSLDSAVTGFSYGVSGVKLPFRSVLMITFAVTSSLFFALFLGEAIALILPENLVIFLGAMLLIILALVLIKKNLTPTSNEVASMEKVLFQLDLSSFSLIFKIMKEPSHADINRDKSISLGEGLILVIVLSCDSFAGGIGVAMIGVSWVYTLFATCLLTFLALLISSKIGQMCGRKIKNILPKIEEISAFIPPIILLIMGFVRMGGLLF